MINLTTGVDIIEIPRIARTLDQYGQRFLRRIFTQAEIEYCRGRPPNLAGRFAAKEATMKALGTGVRGVSWKDIEVARAPSGAPSILLHGRAKARAQRLGVREISLSISHSREYAVAFVVTRCDSSHSTSTGAPSTGSLPSSQWDSASTAPGSATTGSTTTDSDTTGATASGSTTTGELASGEPGRG